MAPSSLIEHAETGPKDMAAIPQAARLALSDLGVGQVGLVEELMLPEEVQYQLMHMGFVPGARVVALRRAPAGDPTVYAIDGLEIALRRETARDIHVQRIHLAGSV